MDAVPALSSGNASELNPYVGGSGGLNGGSGGGATPVGAVSADNPQRGVKRSLQGNPVVVPKQLPGFRGRVIDAGAPIKAPKPRNGNLNNETSNVRIPYNRVTPLEFLSSYQGRLSPGDVVFVHKYPPGFVSSYPAHQPKSALLGAANNATLGVNTTSRVVGLDGLNRLLMGSNPEGWKLGMNVMWLNEPNKAIMSPADVTSGGNTATFKLSVLDEYRLDGIVISNDEPGAFTSSGSRDNCLFNIAIQGPTPVNNGYLLYEGKRDDADRPDLYNPLTGVTNARTVEAHARGSAEAGQHLDRLEGRGVPGRVGSPWLPAGKTDFVANFCGTYSMYPSQMFDCRIEILNTLYLGLRAYELSTEAKMQVTDSKGNKLFNNLADAKNACMVFFQYMPFSSRTAEIIHQVTRKHLEKVRASSPALANATVDDLWALQQNDPTAYANERAAAAKLVSAALFKRSSLNDVNAPFDNRMFDAIRTEDLQNFVGAWHLGRVLDTKAARHDPYAGGPRDTAFSCMVDVGLSWRSALPYRDPTAIDTPDDRAPYWGANMPEKAGQQTRRTLTNAAQPCLQKVLGGEFGRFVTNAGTYCAGDSGKRPVNEVAFLRTRQQAEVEKQRRNLAYVSKLDNLPPVAAGGAEEAAYKGTIEAVVTLANNQMTIVRKLYSESSKYNDASPELGEYQADTDVALKNYTDFVQKAIPVGEGGKAKEERETFVAAFEVALSRELIEALSKKDPNNTFEADKDKEFEELNLISEALFLNQTQVQTSVLNNAASFFPGLADVVRLLFARDVLVFNAVAKLVEKRYTDFYATDRTNTTISASLEKALDTAHQMNLRAIKASAQDHITCFLEYQPPPPSKAAGKARAAPAPTGAKPSGTPKPRGKTPPKSRSVAPSLAVAPPAGAASVSSTPLIPTAAPASASPLVEAAAASAAPRRRVREGGESSTTNSVFETMFASSPTAAVPEEPASPTPSSGSDQPTPGPRTFRRIQR